MLMVNHFVIFSLSTEKWQQVTKQVKEIISILHHANLVFGNLHSTKIMVNQNDREPKVKLVGFSWAGKEGEVTYPYFMSCKFQ